MLIFDYLTDALSKAAYSCVRIKSKHRTAQMRVKSLAQQPNGGLLARFPGLQLFLQNQTPLDLIFVLGLEFYVLHICILGMDKSLSCVTKILCIKDISVEFTVV